MSSEELVAALNFGYVCPPEAGRAWRRAIAEGNDMSLVERSLAKNPWQRLLDHDDALRFAQTLRRGRKPDA